MTITVMGEACTSPKNVPSFLRVTVTSLTSDLGLCVCVGGEREREREGEKKMMETDTEKRQQGRYRPRSLERGTVSEIKREDGNKKERKEGRKKERRWEGKSAYW